MRYFNNLFLNYVTGQMFTNVPSNYRLQDTSSVHEECEIWLLKRACTVFKVGWSGHLIWWLHQFEQSKTDYF